MSKLKVFSGSSNPDLAKSICEHLGVEIGNAKLRRFSDGEVNFQVLENVRGMDVFLVQPSCPPVNESIMEMLIMVDAFKRASASRITAVMPYYGYGRQDRKDKPRVPISAKVVGDLLTAVGVNRLLTMELHAGQIQGFFDFPVDHLFATPVILEHLKNLDMPGEFTLVSPDAGGVERARVYAKHLGARLAIIDKRRVFDNEAEIMNIIGEVEGRNAIIVDDMIDTAGTIVKAAQALRDAGAERVLATATHPVLSGPAPQRLAASVLERIIVTDTLTIPDERRITKLDVLSVADLLAEAIRSIHEETSVSRLFV